MAGAKHGHGGDVVSLMPVRGGLLPAIATWRLPYNPYALSICYDFGFARARETRQDLFSPALLAYSRLLYNMVTAIKIRKNARFLCFTKGRGCSLFVPMFLHHRTTALNDCALVALCIPCGLIAGGSSRLRCRVVLAANPTTLLPRGGTG